MGEFRVVDDYSVRIRLVGMEEQYPEGILMSPKYDRVDLYPKLGHAIMRVIGDGGVLHIHVNEETGRRVIEAVGCPSEEPRTTMFKSDHERYLQIQTDNLEEWMND